ncbi:MAG: UDP-N-acetylmuramate dehydrogenase [Syntrophomonadaceae bacterium]|nr:UDP-N-acetylmuramate dehydrogenase [Syntrophomonadaceae bacterium]
MYQELIKMLPRDRVLRDEPMSKHCTFKIGGPADVLVMPGTIKELHDVLQWSRANAVDCYVIGNGSNLLVLDGGVRGVVIELGKRFKGVNFFGELTYALAGTRLSELAKKVALEGLSGLEFAEGIPGSVGGAIAMNAGAYGGEMKNVVVSVMALDEQGEEVVYRADQLGMSYRHSIFQENGQTIIGAYFRLQPDNYEAINQRMLDYSRTRREKQPMEFPSAGSIFKRPEGMFVGTMIEEAGLKGYSIGDAQVSVKHAGFIVNRGHASAQQVLELIEHIRSVIRENYKVELQMELRIIGEPELI